MYTQEQMIEFAEYCIYKYLREGIAAEVTEAQLFDMWKSEDEEE